MNRPATVAAVGIAVVCAILAFVLFKDRHAPPPVTTTATFQAGANDPVTAKAQREIQAVQRKFQDAVRRKDLPGVLSHLTPDFISVNLDGSRLNRKLAEEAMKQSWPHVRSIEKWTLELTELKVEGDRATGLVREHIVSRIETSGQVQTEDDTSNSRNTWVRTPSGWKYKRMVALPAGEGTLGETEYVSQDQWHKEIQSSRAAERREAAQEKDQAAAVKTESPITKAEARRVLEKVYSDFRSAVSRKDADAALKLLTDDYTAEYPTYTRPRGAVESETRRELKAIESIPAWSHEISNIIVNGNVVTATIHDRRTTVYRTPDGKRVRASMDVSMRDTWVRTREGWKNSRTEMISATQNVNGTKRKIF